MRKIALNNFQMATSKTARDINRRIMLNLACKHQPISRADLSRHSGWQRGTESAIKQQLIADRWVTEGAVKPPPRGRKPTCLLQRKSNGRLRAESRVRKAVAASGEPCEIWE